MGGGLVTAVDENLPSLQVSTSENYILVIQTEVSGLNIRMINGYGPQESQNNHEKQLVYDFYQDLKKSNYSAKYDNCQ